MAWAIQIIIVSEVALFVLIIAMRLGKTGAKTEDEQDG
jgi:hypothetical protein